MQFLVSVTVLRFRRHRYIDIGNCNKLSNLVNLAGVGKIPRRSLDPIIIQQLTLPQGIYDTTTVRDQCRNNITVRDRYQTNFSNLKYVCGELLMCKLITNVLLLIFRLVLLVVYLFDLCYKI